MTRTLVVSNWKGGTGKTTLSVHLAAEFAASGLRVLRVDLDAQNPGRRRFSGTGSRAGENAAFKLNSKAPRCSVWVTAAYKDRNHPVEAGSGGVSLDC